MAVSANQGQSGLRDTLLRTDNMRYALSFIANVKNSKAVARMVFGHGGHDAAVMAVFNGAKAASAGRNIMVWCCEATIRSAQRQAARAQTCETASRSIMHQMAINIEQRIPIWLVNNHMTTPDFLEHCQ
jgi:hypothetical protein